MDLAAATRAFAQSGPTGDRGGVSTDRDADHRDTEAGELAPLARAMLDEVRLFWDADAPTYDRSPTHLPRSPAVRAAWTAALSRLLPAYACRVLDVGAGTGFLSLMAARLGHEVTALDISAQMLDRLLESARRENLDIHTVVGPAHLPPRGFDAVIERHLLWTLPDPAQALRAWRSAAIDGRLVLFESIWGTVDPVESLRGRLRHTVRRAKGEPPEHHGSYEDRLRRALPLGSGTPPKVLVEMVGTAGWKSPRLERLRDVEWSERCELTFVERLAGVAPRFVVSAD